jgi:integrase
MKTLLTDSLISKTICPESKVKITMTDSRITGFCVEVRSTGVKTFILRYQDQARIAQQYKIGDATVIKASDARQIAAELVTRIAAGENPQAERMVNRTCPTFEVFTRDHYLPYVQTNKRSWEYDVGLLKNHLTPAFGKYRLNAITKGMLENYKQEKIKTLAAGTVNRHLVLLRYMLNLAIDWETMGFEKNPAAKLKMLPDNNKRNCILTDEQMQNLLVLSKGSQNKTLFDLVATLAYTGARKREILDAKWEYVDWENNTLLVPCSKNGKPRFIPLNGLITKILMAQPTYGKDGEFIFPSPKTGKPFTSIYYSWNYIRQKAGLAHVRMHDLRHNFASWLVMNGETLYTVQNILGHADPKTTQRYAHLSNAHLVAASNGLVEKVLAGSAAEIMDKVGLRQVA